METSIHEHCELKSYSISDIGDDTTRKGKGEERAALRREGKVTAGVAACAVGAMTSLPNVMNYHVHTHAHAERRTERPIS